MAASDLVVVHNSGLGNDALVFGLVVLLDVFLSPLGNGRVLATRPAVQWCTGAELRQMVDGVLTDTDDRLESHRRAEDARDFRRVPRRGRP